MPPLKKKYMLNAVCLKCNFSMSTQVEVEPKNLTETRLNFAKQVSSAHNQHPDLNNFDVSAQEIGTLLVTAQGFRREVY